MKQSFNGGTHHHYYTPPKQQDLKMENKDSTITIRLFDSESKAIKDLANKRGLTTSEFCRRQILNSLKNEKKFHDIYRALDDMFT